MNDNFIVRIKTQYELEYSDNEMTVKVTVDDLREPVPLVILSKFLDSKGLAIKEPISNDIRITLYKRIADYLKQQGYTRIYTEEFGEI